MATRQVGIVLLAPVLVLAASGAAFGASTGKRKPPRPRQPAPPAPKVTDRDADKIFDDLEGQIAAAPDAKHKVIVRLNRPVTDAGVAKLQVAAGRFAVGVELPIIDGFAAVATSGQIRGLARRRRTVHVARDAPVHWSMPTSRRIRRHEGELDDQALTGEPSPVPRQHDRGRHRHRNRPEPPGHVPARHRLERPRQRPAVAHDDEGHGTHVAGIIAGGDPKANKLEDGAAPGSKLVGIKVLNSAGSGSTSTDHQRDQLDGREQGDLQHQGRQHVARFERVLERRRPALGGGQQRGRGRDRHSRRRRQ